MNLKNLKVDNSWTLFLDRDGVINRRIPNDYVKTWSEFEFIDGVKEALIYFSKIFKRIIVVTNQQGIGKGLMSHNDLLDINVKLIKSVEGFGGKISAIFYSPYLEIEKHYDRKPMIGMACKAKKTFHDINFRKSIMIGDSKSDIEFGKRLGMVTILVKNENFSLTNIEYPDFQVYNLNGLIDNF